MRYQAGMKRHGDSPVKKETSIPIRRRLLYSYFQIRYFVEELQYDFGLWHGPSPTPHAVKRRIVRTFAATYSTRMFIETGTYMGDMVAAMIPHFDEVYSIELSESYFDKACLRFARNQRVHLYSGDSAEIVPTILPLLKGPALFWLDAHYSGGTTARGKLDTPVMQELQQILHGSSANHVILIDDARCFSGANGYPTVSEVEAFVAREQKGYSCTVEQDIIRVTPPTHPVSIDTTT